MLLYVNQLDNERYKLFCSGCGIELDIVDHECLRWHLTRQVAPFCFDCDALKAENIPDCLDTNGHLPTLYMVGDRVVEW